MKYDKTDKIIRNIQSPKINTEDFKEKLRIQLIQEMGKKSINDKIIKNQYTFFSLLNLRNAISFSIVLTIVLTGIFIYFGVFNNHNLYNRVSSLEGNILYKENGKKEFRNAQNQITLKNGDSIKTDKNSILDFKVGIDSIVKINNDTSISIVAMNKKNESINSQIFLEKGKIECDVKLPTKESIFQIVTDNSLISVKGTLFSVEVLENKDMILKVARGIVEVSNYIKPENLIKIQSTNECKILVSKDKTFILKNDEIKNLNQKLNVIKNYDKSKLEEVNININKIIKIDEDKTNYIIDSSSDINKSPENKPIQNEKKETVIEKKNENEIPFNDKERQKAGNKKVEPE